MVVGCNFIGCICNINCEAYFHKIRLFVITTYEVLVTYFPNPEIIFKHKDWSIISHHKDPDQDSHRAIAKSNYEQNFASSVSEHNFLLIHSITGSFFRRR